MVLFLNSILFLEFFFFFKDKRQIIFFFFFFLELKRSNVSENDIFFILFLFINVAKHNETLFQLSL